MPKNNLRRWLFIPDSHTPYHDKRALESLILNKIVPAFDWYGICILGDFFDNYSVSQHDKNPSRTSNLRDEMKEGFKLLTKLEGAGFERKIFVEGNHETRLPRSLGDKFPEVYEYVMDKWEEHFLNWEYVPYRTDTQIGKLNVTHDVGHAGPLSTRQTLHAYEDNVVMGHNHNMLYVVEGNAKGVPHVGASFGWLGDAEKIDYMHRMKALSQWTLGFGTGYERVDNGFMYLTPHPIIDYSTVVEGRLFTA